jgi:antitoxin VapB
MFPIDIPRSDPRILEACALKREKLRSWLASHNFDGIVISRRDNFAWLTTGGDNRVINCSEVGVGHIVITPDRAYLVAYYMDSDRMIEDQVPGQSYDQVTLYWYQGDERIYARDLAGARVAADTKIDGAYYAAEEIKDLQWPLNDIEVERTRWIGSKIGEILGRVLHEVEPGMTEREIQTILHAEIIRSAMDYEVAIVGSDDRIHRYRHVLATDKRLDRYLLLGPVVRRWGLFGLVSRSMHFGEPPPEVRRAFEAAATIEGRVISMLEPGLPFAGILECQKVWYEELGIPNGWIYHFQGGPTGYTLVDGARSMTKKVVQSPQPFSWFITVPGAKVEELTLLSPAGKEIVSLQGNWPTLQVETAQGPISVPGMLIR